MKDIKKNILIRMYVVYFVTVIFTFFIIGRIIRIQFQEGEDWRKISQERNFKNIDIKAIRGNIISADGKQLVLSKPVYDIYFDPWADYLIRFKDTFNLYINPLADSLAKNFNINKRKFIDDINRIRKNDSVKVRAYLIVKGIDFEQKEKMSQYPLFRKGRMQGGFVPQERYITDYPFGTLAKRTLGIAEQKKYGINWCYDKELSGTVGKQYVQRMKGGEWLPVNSDSIKRVEPKDGYDIVTTIDFKMQDFAETELANKLQFHNANWGCIVLMEVATGHVKAIANLAYDTATKSISEKNNYAVAHLIEPGSTFKLASLMVAHDQGHININDTIDCEDGEIVLYGKKFSDSRKWGYGKINVRDIFKVSSNIGVVKIIEKYYNYKVKGETSAERWKRQQVFINGLTKMRINQTVQTEIENEPRPRIGASYFSDFSLLQMSYGYELMFTPLQILTFYNAVANNGKMVKPMFVSEIREGNRTIKKIEPTVLKERIASKETIVFAKEILEAVVKDQDGTARSISGSKYYDIAGKTGTAKIYHPIEKYNHSTYYISSFAGYFPADNPKYSCIVVIHEPKRSGFYGAVVSAPVFKAISDKVYSSEVAVFTEEDIPYSPEKTPPLKKGNQKEIKKILSAFDINIVSENPDSEWSLMEENDKIVELKEIQLSHTTIPDVKGMSLKDAIYILENMGLKVNYKGMGTVKTQTPEAGEKFAKGESILLTLSL